MVDDPALPEPISYNFGFFDLDEPGFVRRFIQGDMRYYLARLPWRDDLQYDLDSGRGVRIRGGLPRSYYIGVEVARPAVPGFAPPTKAICVAPQGMEEGATLDLPGMELGLVLGELVEFPFMTSNQRPEDQPGQTVDDWEDDDEIEQIATVTSILRMPDQAPEHPVVPVQLQTVATEVGTLELWCQQKGGPGRWKLEFEVRENK